MTSFTKDPLYQDEDLAREHFEKLRWPDGPVCPHCGVTGDEIATVAHTGKRTKPVQEGKRYKPARAGLYYCNACEKQFTVRVGTVLEKSHIPFTKWVYGFRRMCSSNNGISAHQLHRELSITYKSAWFMCHRIREAMRQGGLAPMGGKGRIAESDETYVGRKKGSMKPLGGASHKNVVLTLIDRESGEARSFHVETASVHTVTPIVRENIAKETKIATDDAAHYNRLKRTHVHDTVEHTANEYVRGWVHTNSCENYFSVFKRGMRGVYQHCSEKHLHRYLSEYDFRYSNRSALGVEDIERADKAMQGIEGKRLTYRSTNAV